MKYQFHNAAIGNSGVLQKSIAGINLIYILVFDKECKEDRSILTMDMIWEKMA